MLGPVREVLYEVEDISVVGVQQHSAVEAPLLQGGEVALQKREDMKREVRVALTRVPSPTCFVSFIPGSLSVQSLKVLEWVEESTPKCIKVKLIH